MELFRHGKTNIDFMGKRHLFMGISLVMVLLSWTALGVRGLNFGIDFTGGTVIEVGYPQAADLGKMRSALAKAGYGDAVVQSFGTATDVLIRLAPRPGVSSSTLSEKVTSVLQQQTPGVELRRQEFVGPQVGSALVEKGGMALLITIISILVYVSLRFEFRFSVGAVVALIHDISITMGVFAAFHLQFDLTVLAAVLAVLGYSLNDTIVVYDRIRENFRKMRRDDVMTVVNVAVNQTLSRTVMTSAMTLLVVVALFFFGGELIHGFATALLVGIVVGTYSSIYVASALAVLFGLNRDNLMPVKKEGASLDDRP